MLGEFELERILNKRLTFDTTIADEEIIMDINDSKNDKYWIEHKPGTNYFTLRLENGP